MQSVCALLSITAISYNYRKAVGQYQENNKLVIEIWCWSNINCIISNINDVLGHKMSQTVVGLSLNLVSLNRDRVQQLISPPELWRYSDAFFWRLRVIWYFSRFIFWVRPFGVYKDNEQDTAATQSEIITKFLLTFSFLLWTVEQTQKLHKKPHKFYNKACKL